MLNIDKVIALKYGEAKQQIGPYPLAKLAMLLSELIKENKRLTFISVLNRKVSKSKLLQIKKLIGYLRTKLCQHPKSN